MVAAPAPGFVHPAPFLAKKRNSMRLTALCASTVELAGEYARNPPCSMPEVPNA